MTWHHLVPQRALLARERVVAGHEGLSGDEGGLELGERVVSIV